MAGIPVPEVGNERRVPPLEELQKQSFLAFRRVKFLAKHVVGSLRESAARFQLRSAIDLEVFRETGVGCVLTNNGQDVARVFRSHVSPMRLFGSA